MRTYLLIAAGVVVVLAVVSQLVLPRMAESQIEDRLEEGGGTAEANLSAFPAARLLFQDGGQIEVTGSGLELELDEDRDVFSKLDGFDDVDVSLTDFTAGPFDVSSFELHRSGSEAYDLVSSSTASGSELVDFSAETLGLPGGDILGFFADQVTGDEPLPIELDMRMESDDGRIVVTEGGGTVAGLPTGPLASVLTAAIVVQL